MKKIIYVVCPANVKTGGPELLHQLVYWLNKQNQKAYIAYVGAKEAECSPTVKEFRQYVSTYKKFEDIDDNSDNIVILPEVNIDKIANFSHSKIIIWWLSIDNYFNFFSLTYFIKHRNLKGIYRYFIKHYWRFSLKKLRRYPIMHMVQSYYAYDFLHNNNFKNIYYLSDYINEDYLNGSQLNPVKRKNQVLYNPSKGIKFTKYLMSLDKSITWIPLINLKNDEIKKLLQISKVYVDFGEHPGKDRLPRESAIMGCCVVVGKRGSAKFYEDVAIPDKYKFIYKKSSGKNVIKLIYDIFANFDCHQKEFSYYRYKIREEPNIFLQDIKKIFNNIDEK